MGEGDGGVEACQPGVGGEFGVLLPAQFPNAEIEAVIFGIGRGRWEAVRHRHLSDVVAIGTGLFVGRFVSERDFRSEYQSNLPVWMQKIGFSREYSRADTWITTITVLWPLAFTVLFVVGTLYAVFFGIPQGVWVEFWRWWTWLIFGTGCVIVVWFTIGGFLDLKRMYAHLEKYRADARDDGSVEKGRDA